MARGDGVAAGARRGQVEAAGRGIVFMIVSGALLTANDSIVKWMSADLPIGQIMFLRGIAALALVSLAVWHAGGREVLAVTSRRGVAARALLVAAGTFMFVSGLKFLPLADCITLAFAGPLITTALAAPLLGEHVGWRRWAAVLVGFGGVLLIVRPSGEGIAWAALLPLGATLTGAVRDIITRSISRTESSLAMLFYTTLAVTLAGGLTFPLGWQPVAPQQIGLLAVTGALVASAHYFQIEAFRFAEAATVTPFRYSTLVWAVLLGWVLFGDLPRTTVWAGAVLVVASGLYIWWRERRLARALGLRPGAGALR